MQNALSVDVEDYYHASALAAAWPRREWHRRESRVDASTRRVLDLLAAAGARATFFVLGSVAARNPRLIRAIAAAGHEIASHGYAHFRVGEQRSEQFARDVSKTRMLLEDVTGVPVFGYRAPSFSIAAGTWWAYDALAEAGYRYSSSVNPIRHDHYGLRAAPRFPFRPSGGSMIEIPVGTVEIGDWRIPCGGGGYFRLLPFALSRAGLRRINRENRPAVFYFHPWEIDSEQPRAAVSGRTRFRHYVNLAAMEAKLRRLVSAFVWRRMDEVFENALAAPRALTFWQPATDRCAEAAPPSWTSETPARP